MATRGHGASGRRRDTANRGRSSRDKYGTTTGSRRPRPRWPGWPASVGLFTMKLDSSYSGMALTRATSRSMLTSPRFPRPGDPRRPPRLFVRRRRDGEER